MIALTGYASAGDLREALERGFDMHLAKPVDPENLAVQIEALVREVSFACRGQLVSCQLSAEERRPVRPM